MKTSEQALHDLLAERYELWTKIKHGNTAVRRLPEPQKHLLSVQLNHMRGYLDILDLRIADLNDAISNDLSNQQS